MKFMVKTLLGIFLSIVLVYADAGKSNINFDEQCQVKLTFKNKIEDLF